MYRIYLCIGRTSQTSHEHQTNCGVYKLCACARTYVKPGSLAQYDAGASVKSAEQHCIVNEFYVGTLGAPVRATATPERWPT